MNKLKFFLVLIVISSAVVIVRRDFYLDKGKKFTFSVSGERPSSLDPFLYDYFKHHPVQSMLHCTLTSLYRGTGAVAAELAESWKEENGGTLWRFKLRNDVHFSNGDRVTPEIVQQSLSRIFYLFRKQNTNYVFINKLKGISDFKELNGSPSGLRVDSKTSEVIFEFDEPIKGFSEAISFGHFAIVHPKHFDPKTGQWILNASTDLIGCGPYRVKSDTEQSFKVVKRSDYPDNLSHRSGFSEIEMVFESSFDKPADIMLGGPNGSAKLEATHKFFPNGSRTITYLRVFPWAFDGAIWKNKELRKTIRKVVYQNFKEKGANFSKSFFPTTLNGVTEPIDENEENSNPDLLKKLSGSKINFGDPYPENYTGTYTLLYQGLMAAFDKLGFQVNKVRGIPVEVVVELNENPKKKMLIDIGSLWTGISLEDPESDVRLMFSKEGIDLPDPTGKISQELKKSKINIQFINQQLYDDAIIWPISISNRGIWVRKDLDLSDYNTLKPLGELQWIGHN